MKVELVSTLLIDSVWPQLADGFHRALMKTGGDASAGDLWVQARQGSAFLFVAHEGPERIRGASLWRFETWMTGQRFRCLAAFGEDMDLWYDDMETTVRQAAGHAEPVFEGRAGWLRKKKLRPIRTLYEVANG